MFYVQNAQNKTISDVHIPACCMQAHKQKHSNPDVHTHLIFFPFLSLAVRRADLLPDISVTAAKTNRCGGEGDSLKHREREVLLCSTGWLIILSPWPLSAPLSTSVVPSIPFVFFFCTLLTDHASLPLLPFFLPMLEEISLASRHINWESHTAKPHCKGDLCI